MPSITRRSPFAPLTATLALLAAAALFAASAASAATVTREGSTLVLAGAPGEVNHLAVGDDEFSSSRVQFADRGGYGIAADPALGCEGFETEWGGSFLNCPSAGITEIRLDGADGDDELDISPHDLPAGVAYVLVGGPGNDDLEGPTTALPVSLFGGEGNDKLGGGHGDDYIDGGLGDDQLEGNDGNDQVLGGAGDDVLAGGRRLGADLIDGGPGSDSVLGDWSDPNLPAAPIDVTLDGAANDGRAGEGDNVVGIERIRVGLVARLVAAAEPVDFEIEHSPFGDSTLVGGPGADRLAGDVGDDTIVGGGGPDTIFGDLGDDTVEARDGVRDKVDCGYGERDLARVDAADAVSNCESVERAGGGGGGGGQGGGCVVPKVKRGAKLAAARAKLKRAHCAVKVVRVSSKLKPGRVLKLAPGAGKRVRAGAKVTLRVSRGGRRAAASTATASLAATASSVRTVSAPAGVVDPVKVGCIKLSYGGRACGKRFDDKWKGGWWADPTRWEVVDVHVFAETKLEIPNDEYKEFSGEGIFSVEGRSGTKGTVKLPSGSGGPPVSVAVVKPVKQEMESIGEWRTKDGAFGCGEKAKPGQLPSSFAGAFVANPGKGTISVQWSVSPTAFSCEEGSAIETPTFEALPLEAMTVTYRASRFRDADLLKLPVKIDWEGVQSYDGARLHLEVSGRVVLRRVHHRL